MNSSVKSTVANGLVPSTMPPLRVPDEPLSALTSQKETIPDKLDIIKDSSESEYDEEEQKLGLSSKSKKISKGKPNTYILIDNKQPSRRQHYEKIDDDMRRNIVFEVMVMKESLKDVYERYKINFSSAKNVIQIYKKEGRLEKKIIKKRKTTKKDARHGRDMLDESFSEDESDDGIEIDENGEKIVTLAPKEQRCKLNLFVEVENTGTVSIKVSNSRIG